MENSLQPCASCFRITSCTSNLKYSWNESELSAYFLFLIISEPQSMLPVTFFSSMLNEICRLPLTTTILKYCTYQVFFFFLTCSRAETQVPDNSFLL